MIPMELGITIEKALGSNPDLKSAYQEDEITLIKETALNLQKRKTLYYSGHCTGDAVNYLKEILGDQLQLMYTGLQLQI